MSEKDGKVILRWPPGELVLTLDALRGWEPAGFRIKLIIDADGYLVDEPRYMDGTVVGRAPGCSDYTGNGSFIGYRLRLKTNKDDPADNSVDPKGCRLINGKWYCP